MSEKPTAYFDDSIDVTVEAPKDISLDWRPYLRRYAAMANKLLVHEIFVSCLGPGTIRIIRLPWSIRIDIEWNDRPDHDDISLYVSIKSAGSGLENVVYNVLVAQFLPGADV